LGWFGCGGEFGFGFDSIRVGNDFPWARGQACLLLGRCRVGFWSATSLRLRLLYFFLGRFHGGLDFWALLLRAVLQLREHQRARCSVSCNHLCLGFSLGSEN
jgi:hypothetical protein